MIKPKSKLIVPCTTIGVITSVTGCSGGIDKATSDRLLQLEEQNKQLQTRNKSLEERLAKAESQISVQSGPQPSTTNLGAIADKTMDVFKQQ